MNIDPMLSLQLPLFVYGEPAANLVELFPIIWNATESLASSDSVTRHHGIDTLLEVGAQRASPLVAYVITTCLTDPDIYVRRRVVYILADLINPEQMGRPTPENVKKVVSNYLHNVSEETIIGLLEVAVVDQVVEKSIFQILNACPAAGKYLGDIVTQWRNPLSIRQKAVHFIGLVGYLEALPVLERLFNRLDARLSGQYVMSFAPSSIKSDEDILPYLRVAIHQLRAS
jgi:hypothetical protein